MRNYNLDLICHNCGQLFIINVNKEDFNKYMNHEGYIQDVLPYLTAGERELILSKTCNDCYNKMFEMEDDNED
jgi:hypothetical protein